MPFAFFRRLETRMGFPPNQTFARLPRGCLRFGDLFLAPKGLSEIGWDCNDLTFVANHLVLKEPEVHQHHLGSLLNPHGFVGNAYDTPKPIKPCFHKAFRATIVHHRGRRTQVFHNFPHRVWGTALFIRIGI